MTSSPSTDLTAPDTALIVIDVQNDFCPGGALAVADGDAVVAPTNRLITAAPAVFLTQDWHPAGHSSFASSHVSKSPFDTVQMPYGPQTLWPDHCVQGSAGAAFHPDLLTDPARMIVRKGYRPQIDSYSAFLENDQTTPTGLAAALKEMGIHKLVFTGLATDFCVAFSALDAVKAGFGATIVTDAVRAIDLDGSLALAYAQFEAAGVTRLTSETLV